MLYEVITGTEVRAEAGRGSALDFRSRAVVLYGGQVPVWNRTVGEDLPFGIYQRNPGQGAQTELSNDRLELDGRGKCCRCASYNFV